MKKFFLIAVAACVALASCTKNEVAPSDPQEISYQTVETKAATAFSTSNQFYSFAYYLPESKSWATNYADGELYINNSLISYVDSKWKNASTTYYWPKQGSLTFFAWTDNTTNPTIGGSDAAVLCANNTGIQFKNYDITTNLNKDLLVADMKADQTGNTTVSGDPSRTWTEGVPTVFKHVLSNLVFVVKTSEEFSSATLQATNITLKKVKTKGNYTQGSPTVNGGDVAWSDLSEEKDLVVFSNTATTFNKTGVTLAPNAGDYVIVMPQNFDGTPKIEFTYTITTNYGVSHTETVTETLALQSIFGNGWDAGKKYTLTITVGMKEILWDPIVEDWDTTGSTGSATI